MQKKYFIILLHLVLHSFVLQSQVNIYPHFYKSELSLPVIKKWSTSGSYLAVAGISVSKSYSVNAVKVWNSKTGDSIASIVLAEFKTITSIDIDEQTNSLLYAVENYNFFSDEPKFKLYFLSLKTNSLLDSLAIEDKIIEIRNDKKNIYLFTQSDKNVALRSPDKFHCINRLSNKVVKSGLLHLEDIQIISYNKVNCLAYCNNNYWDKYRSLTIKDVAMPNDSVLFNDIEGEPKCVIEETTGQFIVASTTISNGIISIYNNKQQLSKIEIANVSDIKKIEVLNGILYVLVQSSNSSNKRSIYCYELSNMTQIDITNKVAEDAIDFKMNATGFAALSNIDTNYSFSYVNYSPVIIPITTQMQTPHSGAIYKMVSHSNKQLLATTSNDNHIKIWDYNTGFIVADIKESTTNFESAAFHFNANSNTFFYSDPIGNTIKCYDLNKRRVVKTITLENLGYSNKWISTLHDCSKWVVAQSASNSTIKNPIYEFYDLNINDNKIVKTGELHKDIWEMQLLNKGEDILCKLASPESNNKNEMYLDIAPFTTCTKKGEMLGSVEIKNLYHWVVNEQGTEVAFVTKQYKTDKNENWGMQIHIYSLPQFAKLKTISLPNYTSANINKKFSQIVGLKQADYPYDSLYLTKVSDMSIIKKATVDNLYTSSNPFLFSAKDEFVFIRKDSSFIKWGIGCEKVELSKQDCTSFYVDTLRRKAYYSNDGYLSSIKLNTISKGEKLDNIKSDVKLISNSLGFVIYTKYGRLAGIDNDTICVKDPNGKRIISIVGKFINATAKFSDTIVVAFIPKKYTGFIHLQYYSSLGKFISADSIAGDFPVFFSNVKPYLICSNKEANKRILYNYKSKNEMKNFSINYRVMNEEYLSNFCFDESDNAVFWAESTVLKKYDILVDSIYTHTYNYDEYLYSLSINKGNILAKTGNIYAEQYILVIDTRNFTVKNQLAYSDAQIKQVNWLSDTTFYTVDIDGVISWHNLNTRANYLQTIISNDGNVLHYNPSNKQYASSTKKTNSLAFVYNAKVVPFYQFDMLLNKPSGVMQLLGFSDSNYIRALEKATNKRLIKFNQKTTDDVMNNLQLPVISVTNNAQIPSVIHNKKMSFNIVASDSLFKINVLHILINGVPVYGKNGLKLLPQNKVEKTALLELATGNNKIELFVLNENAVESLREIYNVEAEYKDTSKLYFIGIGLNDFNNNRYNLKYSVKDIQDLANKFKEKYNSVIIDTLFNASATTLNIVSLKQKLLKTNINDKVIICYSGHGLFNKKFDYYLSTYNINFENPDEYGLAYEAIENLLDSIPAGQKLLMIDACHSGEVDKDDLVINKSVNAISDAVKGITLNAPQNKTVGLQNSFELMQNLFINIGQGTGTTIISAAGGTQYALESGNLKNGVFTYSVLKAMSANTAIKVSELKKQVGIMVEELTNGKQKPTSRNEAMQLDWNVW